MTSVLRKFISKSMYILLVARVFYSVNIHYNSIVGKAHYLKENFMCNMFTNYRKKILKIRFSHLL